MTDHSHAAHGHAGEHSHGGLGKYLAVFAALLALTVISFAVANSSLMNTPAVGWVIMMAVSSAKALLVIAFFMHMIWEANWKYVLTIPASIMSCFLVLMLIPDVGFRTRHYTQQRWHNAPAQVLGERSITHGEHHGPPLPFTLQEQEQLEHSDHDHAKADH